MFSTFSSTKPGFQLAFFRPKSRCRFFRRWGFAETADSNVFNGSSESFFDVAWADKKPKDMGLCGKSTLGHPREREAVGRGSSGALESDI